MISRFGGATCGARAAIILAAAGAAWGLASDAALAAPDLAPIVSAEGQAFVKSGGSDGLSIAVVRDGNASFFNFGTTAQGAATPPTPDTVYEIGSISKTMESLILAHAVVEKKVGLADDMRRYLPGAYPNLSYRGQAVTLAELVNTTSALPNNLPDFMALFAHTTPPLAAHQANLMLATYSSANLYSDLHKATLVGPPGQVPRHSNVAAELVGLIDQTIYRRPYDALVTDMIEQPMRMQSGTAAARLKSMAAGYGEHGEAMPLMDASILLPAGGLRYSARDMSHYVAAQLDERDTAIALTHQPSWGNPDDNAVGFNWDVTTTLDGVRRLFASGGTFGFASFIDLYPARHTGIVVLANRDAPMTQAELQGISEHIVDQLWGKPQALLSLEQALAQRGYDNFDSTVTLIERRHPELHLSEDYVNRWGYRLLGAGRAKDAVGVLTFNTAHHPQSWNAYDSLAEAMRAAGDVSGSMTNYRRSLMLNASNTHARDQLQDMEKKN
jgi:serine-type D-Ala-D-Ala carboxypeptidase/endopeptidase